jgi:hypothetical protein
MLDTSKMEPTNGYLQGDSCCVDESLRELPAEYKKRISQGFYSLNIEQINYRITGDSFYVSKKMDGHLQLIVFDGEHVFMMGRRGIIRTGLPCLEETKSILVDKGVTSIIAAAELYMQKDDRSRVYDVIAALSHEEMVETLGLAFFEILELQGQSLKTVPYETIYNKLAEIFPETGLAHVVETRIVKSKADIHYLFGKWVEEESHEGLVVRGGDMPFMYKIKPKHTFDVVIVGYVEGVNDRKGMVKSLLFAFMREPGIYQIAGKVGNNLSEDERKQFLDTLSQKHVDSTYIETDNEGIAFHMVSPEIVIEVGCNDIMTENTYSEALVNNLVKFGDGKYSLYNSIPGVRFIYPVFERIRDDKSNNIDDIRFSQLTDLVYLSENILNPEQLPPSKLLFREVYTKNTKDKVMIQKFITWKTNKETVDSRYPAYVMYYTNFSSGRKEPLQNDVRVSNSEAQIMEITEQFIKSNIKKGWELVDSVANFSGYTTLVRPT